MTGAPLLALADDLTGALACGAELGRSGRRVLVRPWDRLGDVGGADALVLDTASRPAAEDAARERVRAALRAGTAALAVAAALYKRVDSGLRGHVAAELAVVLEEARRPVVIAAAAPAWGVTTVGGVQRIDGAPVSPRAYGDRGEAHAGARLADVLPGRVLELDLASVRGDDLAAALASACASSDFVVCDADEDADLRRIGRALGGLLPGVVAAGSYGLAGALAGAAPTAAAPVLVVAGSMQRATRAQIAALVAEHRAGHVEVHAAPAPADAAPADPAIARTLAAGAAQRVRERRPAGLILVGGETATATLDALRATGIEIVSEPWPATPLVRLTGGDADGLPAIVKSGARGDPRWLVHAVDLLRRGSA